MKIRKEKLMKRIIALFLMLSMLTAMFTGCSNEEAVEDIPEEIVEERSYRFGFSCITMDNPYFIALEESLRKNLEEAGHELITMNALEDLELQSQQIQELIEAKVDAVYLAPYDWIGIGDAVDALKDAGIKIINVDTQIQNFDKVDAYIGSDNTKAGLDCGKDLLEKAPDGGEIVIVECTNRNSINERIKGFEKAIAKKGFKVVARIDSQGDQASTFSGVEKILQEHPNVIAIMCGNDQSALGALAAVNSAEIENVFIYGIDGSPELKKEIAKGDSKIIATAAQSVIEMGRAAAEIGVKCLNGEEFEKTTYIPTELIQKNNVAAFDVDAWQ